MSTLHSRHPPFKAVEASRPPWEADRHVTVTQTSDPDWKPGQGVVPHALAVPPESDVHQLETAEMPPLQAYKLMINGITPRPIAFVSSVAADGTRNLAPYSFFNGVSVDPPVVAFSSIGNKDSYNNIAETKRCVYDSWRGEAPGSAGAAAIELIDGRMTAASSCCRRLMLSSAGCSPAHILC